MKSSMGNAFALLVLGACSRAASQPLLGSAADLRKVATRIGCESREPDYLGTNAFSCAKNVVTCGCSFALHADTTDDAQPRINLLRVDLVACRGSEGSDELAQIVEPLINEQDIRSFRDFVGEPRASRTLEQEAHLAVVQSAAYGRLNVRVKFGAQSNATIGAARRTIWLDTVASGPSSELVGDVPAERPCSLAEPNVPARGYCDSAAQGVAPCELDAATRARYRRRIESVVEKSVTSWRAAIETLIREHKVPRSKTALAGQQADALVGVLPQPPKLDATSPQVTGRLGLQLAAEAAAAWRERLLWNVENLFDADLAKLMLSLPAPEEVSSTVFAERIERRLEQLSKQSRNRD